MTIHSVLQIGDHHTNYCEDYLFIGTIGYDKILCAVMDGCTMGIDSYFASTLTGKLLRKIAKEKDYEALYGIAAPLSLDAYLQMLVGTLFKELRAAQSQLMLEQKELLTTLVLLLLDQKTNQGIILAIGDGFTSIDGQLIDFEQNNKPDYLGFHLSENFDEWYSNQKQKIVFENARDISIATDGIFTFAPVKLPQTTAAINPLEFLALDRSNEETKEVLQFKVKKLEHQFGLKPTDDFAMIRVLL